MRRRVPRVMCRPGHPPAGPPATRGPGVARHRRARARPRRAPPRRARCGARAALVPARAPRALAAPSFAASSAGSDAGAERPSGRLCAHACVLAPNKQAVFICAPPPGPAPPGPCCACASAFTRPRPRRGRCAPSAERARGLRPPLARCAPCNNCPVRAFISQSYIPAAPSHRISGWKKRTSRCSRRAGGRLALGARRAAHRGPQCEPRSRAHAAGD